MFPLAVMLAVVSRAPSPPARTLGPPVVTLPGWRDGYVAPKCTDRADCWCAYHRWVRNGKRVTPRDYDDVIIPAGD